MDERIVRAVVILLVAVVSVAGYEGVLRDEVVDDASGTKGGAMSVAGYARATIPLVQVVGGQVQVLDVVHAGVVNGSLAPGNLSRVVAEMEPWLVVEGLEKQEVPRSAVVAHEHAVRLARAVWEAQMVLVDCLEAGNVTCGDVDLALGVAYEELSAYTATMQRLVLGPCGSVPSGGGQSAGVGSPGTQRFEADPAFC